MGAAFEETQTHYTQLVRNLIPWCWTDRPGIPHPLELLPRALSGGCTLTRHRPLPNSTTPETHDVPRNLATFALTQCRKPSSPLVHLARRNHVNLGIGLPFPPRLQFSVEPILLDSVRPGVAWSPTHSVRPRISPIVQRLVVIEHRVDTRHYVIHESPPPHPPAPPHYSDDPKAAPRSRPHAERPGTRAIGLIQPVAHTGTPWPWTPRTGSSAR